MTIDILPPALSGQLDVLMIDNFDSFTWNLYQQLCLLNANVTVIRNDAISPSQFPQLKINSLIISPGPGHPKTDSGISNAAIEYFQGKVPVLGVCMGLECIVDLYGGEIGYAGEIMHGKVSRIRHDNRGCFKGIPQGIKSTRYHSLSAAHTTLPPELSITSIAEGSGIIMGVRHRKYTVEAVQYHPESILSDGGDSLMRNFLALRGGLWEENPDSGVLDNTLPPFPVEVLSKEIASNPGATGKIPSILEKIYAQRLEDVSRAQSTPGTTLSDLQTLLSFNIAPPLIQFLPRLRQNDTGQPSLLAEIKRASPSKGPISLDISPAAQAMTYALSGAHAISVLTEPKWFLGSLQDMLHSRLSIANLPNRPAILRKDFILSRYQVLESRLWGADTILLIVSMLSEALLRDLYKYSLELGMEPLVEVNNAREMEIALSLPAKVIGVNNRNLHNFEVDMETTSRLQELVKGEDIFLCALSGISTAEDVKRYVSEGVDAVLIGESLMRAKDPKDFIHELLSIPKPSIKSPQWQSSQPLVKVCGIRTKDEALAIADAGADMIGLMFVESSKRHINLETAKEISQAIRTLRFSTPRPSFPIQDEDIGPWFTSHASRLCRTMSRPLLVGVFQNASLSNILHAISYTQLDLVQLHGSEPIEWAYQIPVPVIRVFHIGNGTGANDITRAGAHQFVLLDSLRNDGSGMSGGSGKVVDWDFSRRIVDAGEIPHVNKVSHSTSLTNLGVHGPLSTSSEEQKTEGDPAEMTLDDPDRAVEPVIGVVPTAVAEFPLPIILAGGLTPTNVAAAIARVRPWAVDVSGGVETADGRSKDLEKVQSFIANAKGSAYITDKLRSTGASE